MEYIKSKTSLHEDLYNFCRSLLNSKMTDMTDGKKIEPSRMYAVAKIIHLLKSTKSYEDNMANKKHNTENPKPTGLTPEVIREIEEKILGIRYND